MVEAMGEELRSAGGHLKNAGRAAAGKEARQIDGGQSKVKTMLFRMRNQLRKYFEQEGYDL